MHEGLCWCGSGTPLQPTLHTLPGPTQGDITLSGKALLGSLLTPSTLLNFTRGIFPLLRNFHTSKYWLKRGSSCWTSMVALTKGTRCSTETIIKVYKHGLCFTRTTLTSKRNRSSSSPDTPPLDEASSHTLQRDTVGPVPECQTLPSTSSSYVAPSSGARSGTRHTEGSLRPPVTTASLGNIK